MTQSKKQVLSFDGWKEDYGLEFEPNYSKETEADCKASFEAGAQPRQEEVSELQAEIDCLNVKLKGENERALMLLNHKNHMVDKMQAKVDELQRKYDAMYNAFTVADDCRKDWHEGYMNARKDKDELQKRIVATVKYIEDKYGCVEMSNIVDILQGESNAL